MKDYKKIFEGIVDIIRTTEKSDIGFANICTYIGENCPELNDSEDERIRKELIEHVKDQQSSFISAPDCRDKYEEEENNKYNSWIAWLEKQGDDKVEQKFKIGDWVVFNNKHQSIYQVEKIEDGYYILRHTHGGTFRVCVLHDESLRPWTIQDAKAGDVLATKAGGIFIYKELLYDKPFAYCGVDKFGVFKDCNCGKGLDWTPYLSDVTPATKEQRDFLFKKMKEAGYKWDAEKKILLKIPKYEKSLDEQNSAWSEEDVYNSKLILSTISQDQDLSLETKDKLTSWLKFIKNRVIPQPKQEWSEEDENYKDALIGLINEIKSQPLKRLEDWDSYLNWIKSLRPHKQWKPSDEQITWLYRAADDASKDSRMKQVLNNLLSDLKKLREE